MALIKKCKTCKGSVSTSAKVCPHCGQKLKGGIMGLIYRGLVPTVVFVLLVGSLLPEPEVDGQSVAAQPTTSNVANTGTQAPIIPTQQQDFIRAIEKARSLAKTADNDMQKGAALRNREDTLCNGLPASKAISDWRGKIYSISANGDGKGVLVVTIGEDAWASTWNNAFSDISYGTLIETGTRLFENVSSLSSGTDIVFSGRFLPSDEGCLSTQNITLNSKLTKPEFVFQFESVSAAD
ncbi:hypothetical protein T8A63_15145 [Sulfitobacter sp. OXR-159]|uniref:hypothetical protein n=1 Tax=Sulfitobacter sp. OXR-159 TaxID=3100174 RepID=UPI002AC9884A|nr:hypothetical protein [Sulfitobacter sp. OXR-159]WPZ28951.1 hypothetical protein T8A63_15145 [Sulfitobacter sp. OXR-159]